MQEFDFESHFGKLCKVAECDEERIKYLKRKRVDVRRQIEAMFYWNTLSSEANKQIYANIV